MSSAGFDTIRQRHPSDTELIGKVEATIRQIASRSGSVVDERSVAQIVGVARERVERLMVELVQVGLLKTVFIWVCPFNGGTAWYGEDLRDAPSWISCPDCLQIHFFSERDVEVHFLPTDELMGDVSPS